MTYQAISGMQSDGNSFGGDVVLKTIKVAKGIKAASKIYHWIYHWAVQQDNGLRWDAIRWEQFWRRCRLEYL